MKETCERHLKDVNKISHEMKDALSRVEIDATQRCRAKDEQFANYKQTTDSKINELEANLEEALKKLVQYDTISREAGILKNNTEGSMMLIKENTGVGSNTIIDPQSEAGNQGVPIDGAMDIDEGPPMIDLSQRNVKNKEKNEETSIQCVQNWSGLNRHQTSLRNEWNYEQDQLKSQSKAKYVDLIVEVADLCEN